MSEHRTKRRGGGEMSEWIRKLPAASNRSPKWTRSAFRPSEACLPSSLDLPRLELFFPPVLAILSTAFTVYCHLLEPLIHYSICPSGLLISRHSAVPGPPAFRYRSFGMTKSSDAGSEGTHGRRKSTSGSSSGSAKGKKR